MIELFVIKDTEWLELVAESVSLEGHRYQAPRSIEATIVTKQGDQTYYSVSEGDTVLFKWKGKELFRGIVFARTPDEHTLAFSAYDIFAVPGQKPGYVRVFQSAGRPDHQKDC